MIDIENKIISDVTAALEAEFLADHPNLCVYDTEVEIPEGFPCVTMVMSENATLGRTREFGKATENHAVVSLTVNVYTNNAAGKKELGKAIFNVIDGILQQYYFTRTMAMPMPNVDRTVARITGRYSATVGEPITETTTIEIDGQTVTTETLVYPVFRN